MPGQKTKEKPSAAHKSGTFRKGLVPRSWFVHNAYGNPYEFPHKETAVLLLRVLEFPGRKTLLFPWDLKGSLW